MGVVSFPSFTTPATNPYPNQTGGGLLDSFLTDQTRYNNPMDTTNTMDTGYGTNRYAASDFNDSSRYLTNLDSNANRYTNQTFGQAQQTSDQTSTSNGQATAAGGNWSALDRFDDAFNQAASQYGVPANLLKAMVNQESSGNWERDNRVTSAYRGDQMLPFVGIFKNAADSWGVDWNAMQGNSTAQIAGMAKILKGLSTQYGGYENAAKVYFGGPSSLNGGFTDELGMDSNTYGNNVVSNWRMLDQKSGVSSGYGDGGTGTNIVSQALQYVGVPYVWGSLPQAGDDPWKTGWDCSAFVNYLDDKYGTNQLPAGSHYQYQDTVNKGLLFTDPNQLQAGDIIFFNTGDHSGGGGNLNDASHVGMYIGNGQFVQAANPSAGTIVSNLSDYMQMYQYMGARHMSWSGGSSTTTTNTGGGGSFTNLLQQYLYKQAA